MTKDVNLMPSDVAVAAPKKKKKKIASLDRRKARAGWVFVLPFVLGFVLVYLPMIYESFTLTFQLAVNKVGGGQELSWIGFENYKDALFTDTGFVQTLLTGLQNLALEIPAILIFSLFMAIMLNQKMVGRAAFRAIFFVPVILSTGIMESIASMDTLSDSMVGGIDSGAGATEGVEGAAGAAGGGLISAMDIESLFAGMKIGTGLVTTIVDLINSIYDIVNRSGVQMLIFLAALQSISPAIYESCKIDGASAWETFWKITLPMLSPMILVNAVYTLIDSFTSQSNTVMSYIKNAASNSIFENRGDEVSVAMAWIYFLIVMLIVGLIVAVLSAFVFYQRKSD